ncbi:hypothetical protein ABZN20_19090 [Methylococcus sp. ANG]|uniref:hypothetical protein n=1 Tax=Methylococcus sp. ANG TaxID=3231903 RepID=UPI003457B1C5
MRASVVLILNALMTGCASMNIDPNDTASINRAVQIRRDPSTGSVFYQGPIVSHKAEWEDNPEVEEVALYASSNPPDSIRYFLTVNDRYQGHWRGSIQASDEEGRVFHAASLQQQVDCEFYCEFQDVIEIELTEEYLVGHKHKGITMRLYGPNSSVSAPFTLTSAYIQGFLLKISKPSLSSAQVSKPIPAGGINVPADDNQKKQ